MRKNETERKQLCFSFVSCSFLFYFCCILMCGQPKRCLKCLLFRRNRSSASDFAYSYTFVRRVVCRLSVVCHTRAPCLNRLTDLDAIWHVHLRGPVTHCVKWGF